jgi:hypothetical protein
MHGLAADGELEIAAAAGGWFKVTIRTDPVGVEGVVEVALLAVGDGAQLLCSSTSGLTGGLTACRMAE